MKSRLLNILFWSVISAAFIGPGTVTTAARAGTDYGMKLLWAIVFATFACCVLQEAAARLTIASGMNLGQAITHRVRNQRRGNSIPVLVTVCILCGTAAYQTGNLLGAVAGINLVGAFRAWILILILGLLAGTLLLVPSVRIIARILGGIVAIMGIAFLVSAVATGPAPVDLFRGIIRPVIPPDKGGILLVLGLIGTTVVPYNLFLGSGLSGQQSIREMRSGLLVAIVLGGIISMAVLVTGTSMEGEFSFGGLAEALVLRFGRAGRWILGVGLFAAGFTSAVTAPLASAITVRSLFGNRKPDRWKDGSLRFHLIWAAVLLTGMGFGMAGFQPVPAIIVAQALNGIILPLMALFLMSAVNDRELMKESRNRLPGNILMIAVTYVTLILGLTGIVRTVLRVLQAEPGNMGFLMAGIGFVSLFITGFVWLKSR